MKRIKLVGLCVVVAFVLSAMVVTLAEAKKREHGPINFPFTKGGPVTLTAVAPINCTDSEGRGEITSPTGGTLIDTLTGCVLASSGQRCTSSGKSAGIIESKQLSLGTGWISKPKGEAGVELRSGSGEVLFEFDCEGLTGTDTVNGPVAGRITPTNLQNPSGMSVAFTTPPLEQTLPIRPRGRCRHEGTPKEKCKPGQAEINTLADATPEFGRCNKASKGTGKYTDANCSTLGKGNFEFVPIPG